jgi:acetoin utilization deacetylase AcuC-like enzyme
MLPVLYTPDHKQHEPGAFFVTGRFTPVQERVDRAEVLRDAAAAAGCQLVAAAAHGLAPVADVHTPEYLCFLQDGFERWTAIAGASPEIIPNVFAVPGMHHGYPERVVGQAGYHMQDLASPIGAGTYVAALASANLAADAACRVANGVRAAYAICRPPGHHAYKDRGGGVCYLNNAAIAAQSLRRKGRRVAIVDVDVHHGNGTQGIFYERDDVYFVSLHRDPKNYHPYFCGYEQERGAGAGLGYNLNLPLPADTGDDGYLLALDLACRRIGAYCPDALVISLGLDAHENDPFKGLKITTDGFRRIGARLGQLGIPSVMVQEGGYDCDHIGVNLVGFLEGFTDRLKP